MASSNQFPRYLNRPKLFIDIEMDILFVTLGAIGVFIGVGFVFLNSISLMFLLVVVGASLVSRGYYRATKSTAPGYIKHYIHSLGIIKQSGNGDYKKSLPYGFEKVFED